MNRNILGGAVPPDYEYFWNRSLGRQTCMFLSAVGLAGLILPTLSAPAQSDPDQSFTKAKKEDNATWGNRKPREMDSDISFQNAIWGNRSHTDKQKGKKLDDSGGDHFLGDGGGGGRRMDGFLAKKLDSGFVGYVDVILKLDGPTSSSRESALMAMGAHVSQRLPLINALAVKLPVSAVEKVAKLPWAHSLSEDVKLAKLDEFTVKSSLADIAFSQTGLNGTGIAVAVLDSGIKARPDINGRIVANVSFVKDDPTTDDPCGHGTHVAGLIAGNGISSTGTNFYRTFYGIARNVNLVNVRVLDAQGAGTVSSIVQAIDWVIANKGKYNIRILNMSLGHAVGESYQTDPLCMAVEKAWKAGIVVVCASGNTGRKNATPTPGMDNEGFGAAYGSIEVPGNSPYCITVGATKDVDGTRANDQISTYSSRGPSRLDFVLKPDLVAPGNRVISLRAVNSTVDVQYGQSNTIPFTYYRANGSDTETPQYFRLSGTSMAAPVVAGAAALLIQKNPGLNPDTVKARLMMTADKWKDAAGRYDVCTFGAGYLNIPKALSSTVVATQYAVSPTLSRDLLGNVLVNKSNVTWGDNIIWGMTGVSSLNVIWGGYVNTPLLGQLDNIIWGSNIIWGLGVWTDNIIWGSNTDADARMNSVFGED